MLPRYKKIRTEKIVLKMVVLTVILKCTSCGQERMLMVPTFSLRVCASLAFSSLLSPRCTSQHELSLWKCTKVPKIRRRMLRTRWQVVCKIVNYLIFNFNIIIKYENTSFVFKLFYFPDFLKVDRMVFCFRLVIFLSWIIYNTYLLPYI